MPPNWRMQMTSLAVTPTAPRAAGRDAPDAPALTLAADTRSVGWGSIWQSGVLFSRNIRDSR